MLEKNENLRRELSTANRSYKLRKKITNDIITEIHPKCRKPEPTPDNADNKSPNRTKTPKTLNVNKNNVINIAVI